MRTPPPTCPFCRQAVTLVDGVMAEQGNAAVPCSLGSGMSIEQARAVIEGKGPYEDE